MIKSLAVFTASRIGAQPHYSKSAQQFGKILAEQSITLIYGGGNVGLMGEIANAALTAGGKVVGVMPQFLFDKEIGHSGITEMHIVDSMHARKAMIAEMADGFIALPGGMGTLDELFEIWCWARLNLHNKPCGVLNVNHYYNHLLALIEHMYQEQFISTKDRQLLAIHDDPHTLLETLNKMI